MKRRDFLGLIVGGAVAWPLSLPADQAPRRKTIATLWPFKETDSEGQTVLAAFGERLNELGWADAKIETRWGGGDLERTKVLRGGTRQTLA